MFTVSQNPKMPRLREHVPGRRVGGINLIFLGAFEFQYSIAQKYIAKPTFTHQLIERRSVTRSKNETPLAVFIYPQSCSLLPFPDKTYH